MPELCARHIPNGFYIMGERMVAVSCLMCGSDDDDDDD